jgi:multidrug efflux pump subunit AcrB
MVEVPPGPPVLAPLVAEMYGLDHARQMAVARQVRAAFEATAHVVDVDDSIEAPQTRLIVDVDRARAAKLGVTQDAVTRDVAAALRGEDMSFLHDPHARVPIPVRVRLPRSNSTRPTGCGRCAFAPTTARWCRCRNRQHPRDDPRADHPPQGSAAGGLRHR